MNRSRDVYRANVDENHDPLRRGSTAGERARRRRDRVPGGGLPTARADGAAAFPAVGSTVWVQFEDGDCSRPVWVGTVWETALAADQAVTSAASLKVRAPLVTVEAGSAGFAGVVRCKTLIAETVISTSYTPGVGNIV